ncbi:Restriction endonuclease [Nocardia amikacinitolerans]|uniref:restriction endonuclease n=1 Tax=Nocardia amikacinitolerans TaxID=756689 RepID=UPI000836B16C|nr:restriction endonuclease [Nocardia amikacinitolerans]MCP2317940.1 Restriction endonuclease [Nocardia amikacinitolerans]
MSKASEAVAAAGGWRAWFGAAHTLPSSATKEEKANRGREFEAALIEMFTEADLAPRSSYRPLGEEIDGSIWLDGRTYLFEAKWTTAVHPASSLYQFKGKVEGKLTGTIGLFFSMSGYSTDAVEALVAGKELNIVLFDGADVGLVVEGQIDIAKAIRWKLRAAAESGTPYLPLNDLLRSARLGTTVGLPPRTVFVEGRFDELVFEYWRDVRNAVQPVQLMATAGPGNMARMIDAVLQIAGEDMPFTAILEEDPAGRRSGREVQELVDQTNAAGGRAQLLWIPGSLEECMGLNDSGGRPSWRLRRDRLVQRLEQVDLDERVRLHPELAPVLDAVGIPVPRP